MINFWCDRLTLWSLYILVLVLPFSTAGGEIFSVTAILCFLLKKILNTAQALRQTGLPVSQRFISGLRTPRPAVSVYLAFGAWTVTLFISCVFSWYPAQSFEAFFTKAMQAALLFFCVQEVVVDRRKVNTLIMVLVVSVVVLCLDGFWQWFTGYDLFKQLPLIGGRMHASLKHPNGFGAYLIAPLSLLISVVIHSLQEKGPGTFRKLVVQLAVAFLLLTAIGLSFSRGAWMGLTAGLICLGIVNGKSRLPLVVLLTVFLTIFAPKIFNRAILDGTNPSTLFDSSGRFVYWSEAFNIIKDHPVTGTGLNTYAKVIQVYSEQWHNYAHNCYIQMTAETGFLGLFGFLLIVVAVLRFGWISYRRLAGEQARAVYAGLLGGFAGVLVQSSLDTTLYSSQLATLFWIWTALCVVYPLVLDVKTAGSPKSSR